MTDIVRINKECQYLFGDHHRPGENNTGQFQGQQPPADNGQDDQTIRRYTRQDALLTQIANWAIFLLRLRHGASLDEPGWARISIDRWNRQRR